MSLSLNRRNYPRVSLAAVRDLLRQCDLNVLSCDRECDALIEDISPSGTRLLLAGEQELEPGQAVFFRGCIFNGLIGFLSSVQGVVRWRRGACCGVAFSEPLELDCMTLSRLVRAAGPDMTTLGAPG